MMKVEFIRSKVFSGNYYFSLWVEGVKTNIYYPESGVDSLQQKDRALATAKLIEEGQVFPTDGSWESFDLCGTIHLDMSTVKEVEIPGKWNRNIQSCSCPYEITAEKKAELLADLKKSKSTWSQWTKRVDEKFNVLYNIGVKFERFGYSVFFY